jgi:hypothetical protein
MGLPLMGLPLMGLPLIAADLPLMGFPLMGFPLMGFPLMGLPRPSHVRCLSHYWPSMSVVHTHQCYSCDVAGFHPRADQAPSTDVEHKAVPLFLLRCVPRKFIVFSFSFLSYFLIIVS